MILSLSRWQPSPVPAMAYINTPQLPSHIPRSHGPPTHHTQRERHTRARKGMRDSRCPCSEHRHSWTPAAQSPPDVPRLPQCGEGSVHTAEAHRGGECRQPYPPHHTSHKPRKTQTPIPCSGSPSLPLPLVPLSHTLTLHTHRYALPPPLPVQHPSPCPTAAHPPTLSPLPPSPY